MGFRTKIKIVVVFLCITGAISQCEDREPQCHSRFDYEYKVLQRLVRLEESHNGLTEKMTASENENNELKNEIKRNIAASENENNELKNEIKRLNDLVINLSENCATKQGKIEQNNVISYIKKN